MNLPRAPVNQKEKAQQIPLTLFDEETLLFTRIHWLVPFSSFLILSLITLFILFLGGIVFLYFYPFLLLFIIFVSLVISSAVTIGLNLYIEWYYHFYVITEKRIAEYCYVPLFTNFVNEVLMERVRCTELDISSGGLINRLLDIGSVTVTFDRPTHVESFVFGNIHNPNEVGELLTKYFSSREENKENTIWQQGHGGSDKKKVYYPFEEETEVRMAL